MYRNIHNFMKNTYTVYFKNVITGYIVRLSSTHYIQRSLLMASITASIRPRNLDHDLLGKPLEYSPDPLDQLVRGVAWSFVGVPLSCAPHRQVRSGEFGGQATGVVKFDNIFCQPFLCFSGGVSGIQSLAVPYVRPPSRNQV